MKKYFLVLIILLISTNIGFAHRQHAHQRLCVEGYNLLKKWYGGAEVQYMKDHIGGLTTDYIGDRAWQKGYITTGAWREDVEDVVYKLSTENPPTISGGVMSFITAVGDALGGSENNDGFISSTHFWYADNGDNISTDMYGAIDFLSIPTTFQFTVPNAYQKIMMFAFPNQAWTLNYQNGYNRTISDFRLPNGSLVTFDWYTTLGFTYNNLIDLYKTGKAWIVGYYNLNGQWVTHNLDSRLPCQVVLGQNWRDIFVWEILGRMCHLLQDVGSPAHANVDPHSDTDQYLRHDNFEEFFGDIVWTADMVYNHNPTMLNPYVSSNPLHFLMYTTQQQANHFASNGPHMNQNNNTFGGNYLAEELSYLNSLNITNYGEPTTMKESIPESEIINERDKLMPQIIRATAGLLYWFAYESGILPPPCTVSTDINFEFDPSETGTTQSGIVGASMSISTPSQITKNGKTYNFAGWNDGNTSNPRTITPQGDEAYTAIYKYVNHSNTTATFANSSQKKFISTGYFYKVYSSINNIWLEKSGDCVNWSIVGNSPVNDLSEGPEAKSPAIDFVTTNGGISYNIYVTYQQKTSNGKYKIKVAKFNDIGQKMFNLDVFTSTMDYSAFDAAPVIAVSHSYSLASNKPKFLIVWRQQAEGSYQSGLYYYGGIDNGNNATLYYLPPQKFTSTDAQSSNPTIAVYKNPVGSILNHVAWQQGTSQIKYRGIADNWNHDDLGGLSEYGSLESPSTGIVLSCNTNPSITVINSNATPEYSYDSPKLAWKASFCGQDYSAAFRDKNNSQYGTTWNNFHLYWSNDGSEINSININSTEYDNYFAFVYSEAAYPTTTNKYVKSTNLSSIQSLNSHFRDLQISNAPEGWMGMNIITFNNSTVPYTFSNAGVILLKNNNLPSEARGCSIIKDYAGFYFNFGDVSINGKSIEFKEKDDTVRTESSQLINKFMQTQPFSISENSSLVYYVSYGVNDSSAVKYELSNDEFINYNLVLIDNITGEILGNLLNINQSKNLIENKKNIGYKVNISNIGTREVVLKLIEKDNLNGEYSFLKIHGSENLIMQKSSFEEISLNSNNPIKNYSLNQNYPNPFNPSTNIHYELPNNGLVTLKVYDELGREVKTLVNQYQTKGRYDINFNADNLASGIYFYRLQSGNFISTKKMLLLK